MIEKKRKIWTTKKGVVGTAHYNRRNELVDFRPGTPTIKYLLEEEHIAVIPPKGQEKVISFLLLDIDRFEKRLAIECPNRGIDHPHRGQFWQKIVYFAIYKGAEVCAEKQPVSLWYDKKIEKAVLKAERDQREAEKETARKEYDLRQEFLKNIPIEEIFSEIARSKIDKLRIGRGDIREILRRVFEKRIVEKFGKNRNDYYLSKGEVDARIATTLSERLIKKLLIFDEDRREKRRKEWVPKTQ